MNSSEFELYKTNPPNSLSLKHISSLLCLSMARVTWLEPGSKVCLHASILLQHALQISKKILLESTQFLLPYNGIQVRHPTEEQDFLQMLAFKSTRCFPPSNENWPPLFQTIFNTAPYGLSADVYTADVWSWPRQIPPRILLTVRSFLNNMPPFSKLPMSGLAQERNGLLQSWYYCSCTLAYYWLIPDLNLRCC